MGDNTHTLTPLRIGNEDTMQVTVPADVQREEGICIDDHVEVTIHNVSELIDKASFTNKQTGGDRVTIPASVSRKLDLSGDENYAFSFENAEEDDVPAVIPDEEVDDNDEVANEIENAESEPDDDSSSLGELFSTDDEDEAEDEQEEEGLGELFG